MALVTIQPPLILKLWTANLANTFTGSIQTKAPEKFVGKGIVGVSKDSPNFLSTPYYLTKE